MPRGLGLESKLGAIVDAAIKWRLSAQVTLIVMGLHALR